MPQKHFHQTKKIFPNVARRDVCVCVCVCVCHDARFGKKVGWKMSDAKSPMNDLGALAFRVEATGVSDGSDGVVKVSGLGLPTGLQVVSSELVRALRGLVIEVEGNIGSGKSTLTETLRRAINDSDTNEQKPCIVHGEKVNTKFLTAYYNASKRYAFAFQSYMLTTRFIPAQNSLYSSVHSIKTLFFFLSLSTTQGVSVGRKCATGERRPHCLS
jgi:hypothetical protein